MSKYGCEGELVKISCDNDRVIDIVRANYGRLSPHVCVGHGQQPQHGDCLHRSSKTILDRECAGHQTCVIRAGQDMFPGLTGACVTVARYLEVHYRCVQDKSSSNHVMRPPWLEDLHATYKPELRSSLATTTRATSVRAPLSDNDTANDDNDSKTAAIITESPLSVSQNISQPSQPGVAAGATNSNANNQGRYFLLPSNTDHVKEDDSTQTLIITITISIISTILSVLIIVHICRKVRAKRHSSSSSTPTDSSQSCYQCQHSTIPREFKLDSDKVNTSASATGFPLYTPIQSDAGEYSHYQQLQSLTPVTNIYNTKNILEQNNPPDNAIYRFDSKLLLCRNKLSMETIFRIPEDYLDSNNYIKHNNILHTQLYGDTGGTFTACQTGSGKCNQNSKLFNYC